MGHKHWSCTAPNTERIRRTENQQCRSESFSLALRRSVQKYVPKLERTNITKAVGPCASSEPGPLESVTKLLPQRRQLKAKAQAFQHAHLKLAAAMRTTPRFRSAESASLSEPRGRLWDENTTKKRAAFLRVLRFPPLFLTHETRRGRPRALWSFFVCRTEQYKSEQLGDGTNSGLNGSALTSRFPEELGSATQIIWAVGQKHCCRDNPRV